MNPPDIIRFIQSRRLPLHSEKACQEALANEFKYAGIEARREVRLGDAGIIDFLIDDIGLELKIRGQRRAIYRQCKGYCEHESISALVLATNAAMGMPRTIEGKPVFVASLGRGWLV